ncbi:MAG: AraC family transcriptional regulator [Acuticoccus sp.]
MGPLPEMLEAEAGTSAVDRVFRAARLPVELIADRRQRIPMAAMLDLFAGAGRETGDRLLGLRVGQAMRPSDYGLWLDYSLAAPTLRRALLRIGHGIRVHQSGPTVHLVERERHGIFLYAMPSFHERDKRQHSDHAVPTMIQVAQAYLGSDWLPDWVAVDYRRDDAGSARTDILPVNWHFGAKGIGLPIPREALDAVRPFDLATSMRAPTRGDVVDAMRAHPDTLEAAVRSLIALDLLDGLVGIEHVAQRLRRSVRSLQRDLGAAGSSYSTLLDEVRIRRAREMLAHPGARVAEVAFALGYGDASNFTRAFRKWTGMSPTAHARAATAVLSR